MEVEEAWEAALDLDDSDLPSLLRPCLKRRRSTSPPTTAPEQQLRRQPPPPASRRRTIPGPAAAVQSAMIRKDLDHQKANDGEGNDAVICTQDYIRRAMDDTVEFDDDFTRHPWISAIQFIGAEDGVVRSTPISSIKKCLNGAKVVQVVAVIKSCTPNGLGGLMVSLKDPTGTVGASIHQKVLSESEFGKNLTTGSVVILREVAIFAPVRSAYYLNITLRNVVKVFCQNCASASKLNNSAKPIQYADPESCGKKANTTEKMSTVQNVTTHDIEKTHYPRKTDNLQNRNVTAAQGGVINLSQDACNEIPEDIIRTRTVGDHQEFVKGNDTSNINESVTKIGGQATQGTDAVQIQSQPLKLKASSLPQWTDEQLDELFAGDDDDGSLF